ncbi:hypothetical protein BDV36DRAFT_258140 [Aspergillus pseudocaelatus]|uniref:Uncharacterized protein n=1 Tax=Aspergillus pseudocaelatus TaxID=1825620 RepID=A0ABQ6WIT8_9EURO|nr:hypothetical protein BDV36DRAFT_258140 [Aspergillus pseudocaelatus]
MQLNLCSHLQHRGSHHCQCMSLTTTHGCPYFCLAFAWATVPLALATRSILRMQLENTPIVFLAMRHWELREFNSG